MSFACSQSFNHYLQRREKVSRLYLHSPIIYTTVFRLVISQKFILFLKKYSTLKQHCARITKLAIRLGILGAEVVTHLEDSKFTYQQYLPLQEGRCVNYDVKKKNQGSDNTCSDFIKRCNFGADMNCSSQKHTSF